MDSKATELISDIQKKTAEITKKNQELIDQLKPQFKDLFIPFLTKWKEVKTIGWTQYTPYFNDGDECVFGVGGLSGNVVDEEDEDFDDCMVYNEEGAFPLYYGVYWGDKKETIEDTKVDKDLIKLFGSREKVIECGKDFEVLNKAFESIPEGIMKEVIGDHVRVCVTTEGIDIEEYDHD